MSWLESLIGALPPGRAARILLSPQGVAWRDGGAPGFPWQKAARGSVSVGGSDGNPWGSPLETLSGVLRGWRGRRSVEVLLAGSFVRWQLLPVPRGVGDDKERQAFAAHRYREIYGDLAGDWSVAIADAMPDEPIVAAAVDQALVAGIRAVAAEGRHRLEGLGPAFAYAFDRLRGRLPRRRHIFAFVEPGRLTCARFEHGRWRALRGGTWHDVPHADAWAGALGELIRDTGMAAGEANDQPPEAIYLCGVERAPGTLAGRPVHHLPLPAEWP